MQHKTTLTVRLPKKGTAKLKMVDEPYYRALVRAIQVTDKFDRVCLTAILGGHTPVKGTLYSSVNAKLVELYDNGFIEAVPVDTTRGRLYAQHEHAKADFEQNPELLGMIDFLKSSRVETAFQKSAKWPDFMVLWKAFIE